jgi:hypothetical protein
MRRVAVLIAAVVLVPVALAAGGRDFRPFHVSGGWHPGDFTNLFSDNGGCGVYQPAESRVAAADSVLTIAWDGLEKPSSADFGQTITYNLRGTLSGQLTDAAGNTFDVSGMFFDRTTATNRGDLQFDGTGRITLTGSAGTLRGDATLRQVTAPNELQLKFLSVKSCAPE